MKNSITENRFFVSLISTRDKLGDRFLKLTLREQYSIIFAMSVIPLIVQIFYITPHQSEPIFRLITLFA